MVQFFRNSLFLLLLVLSACSDSSVEDKTLSKDITESQTKQSKELIVYSSRKEQLVEPLFKAYEKKTGVSIKFVTDKAEPLIQKLKAEGSQTQADVFMTVDAGNLSRAAEAGLLQAIESDVLAKTVPSHLRDPNNLWFGLSQRARTIVYAPDRVKPSELSSYEALMKDQFHGRLCLRTAKKVYNQSLVAMLIAKHGATRTEEIVQGWVNNLATEPFSNDTKAMQAVMAGQCDLTIVNTYYLGRLLRDNPDTPLKIFWPNQTKTPNSLSGVHVNISGAGIVKYARNVDVAKNFLDWLVSTEAQLILANGNLEYPVAQSIQLDPIVAAWGEFNADTQSIALAGQLQPEAVRLMDRASYY